MMVKKSAVEPIEDPARVARQASPADYAGVDLDGNEQWVYVKLDQPGSGRYRVLPFGGLAFEHVADDPDGVWLFKHLT